MPPGHIPHQRLEAPGRQVAVVVAEEGGRAEAVVGAALPPVARAADGLGADGVRADLWVGGSVGRHAQIHKIYSRLCNKIKRK